MQRMLTRVISLTLTSRIGGVPQRTVHNMKKVSINKGLKENKKHTLPSNLIILAIEGNIGAGKSTILRCIEPALSPDVQILMEPVDLFQEYKGTNPLKLFYENPSKHAFFTQRHIIDSQCKQFYEQMQAKEPISLLLTERTLFSSIVFTNTLHKMGWLTENEKEKLSEYSKQTITNMCPDAPMGAHYIFYIHEYPHVCKNRIEERGRQGENAISCKYLSELQNTYLNYCASFKEKHGNFSLRIVPPTLSRQEKEQELLDFIVNIKHKQQDV